MFGCRCRFKKPWTSISTQHLPLLIRFFYSIQDYLYSAYYDTIVAKQLYRKLSFYNRFIYCRNLIYLTYVKIWLILYTVLSVSPLSCVSCVPASCVLIWFVSCPRFLWLWVYSCPAVFVSLSIIILCIYNPDCSVWFRLVYSLLPGVPVCVCPVWSH